MLQLLLLVLLLESLQPLAAAAKASIPLDWAANTTGRRFDGIGGLSGGWITDTLFNGRRGPVMCIFSLICAPLSLLINVAMKPIGGGARADTS
jgi:hypothetical protein